MAGAGIVIGHGDFRALPGRRKPRDIGDVEGPQRCWLARKPRRPPYRHRRSRAVQRHRTASGHAWRLIKEPGCGFCGADAGSIWLRACRVAASESWDCEPDCPVLPARSDAISFDMTATKSCFETLPVPLGSSAAATKSCFETLPVPLGSSAAKMASAPCFWNTDGGFLLWNAWSN